MFLALLTVLVLVGGGYLLVNRFDVHQVVAECDATADGLTFSLAVDQSANATLIADLSVKRGLPPRAASIALAAALQESKLRNLTSGDRDSVGLFQQRPSQGWGTVAQILDPVYATTRFYDALVKVDGYATMPIADAAQAVQRSADGSAYAGHEEHARTFASALTGQSAAALSCALPDPTAAEKSHADPAADLLALLGVQATKTSDGLEVTAKDSAQAWAVAGWAVGRAQLNAVVAVQVGGRQWTRSQSADALAWHTAGSPVGNLTVRISLAR